jgi:hypothetical protein
VVPEVTATKAVPKRLGSRWADLAAPFLLLIGAFLSFLRFQSYGFFQPESLVLTLIFAVIALLYGLWLRRTRSGVGRTLLLTVLLVLAIDFQFPQADGHFRLLIVLVLAATWLLKAHATALLAVMALAFYASNLVLGEHLTVSFESNPLPAQRADLPPLFHFILDEHIGLDGIPPDVPGAAEARADLAETYVAQGFRIFARAYSPYHLTTNAVPNLFNLTRSDIHQSWLGGARAPIPSALHENAYFQKLRDAGYAIRVYQPEFIDLCATDVPPESCYTIPRNAIMFLPRLGMSWYPRLWFILTYYAANHSYLYRRVWQLYDGRIRPLADRRGLDLPAWHWANSRINAAGAIDLLARMRSDLHELPSLRGNAFIAHLIDPHAPYLVDENCRAHLDVRERLEPVDEIDASSGSDRRLRYGLYLAQTQCLAHQLRDFFQEVQRVNGLDAIIVLHGDHGSRIATVDPESGDVSSMTAADFGDLYSAFFAVHAPGIAPGIDTTVIATQSLLRFLMETAYSSTSVPADSAPTVFLPADESGRMRTVRIPPFWKKALANR